LILKKTNATTTNSILATLQNESKSLTAVSQLNQKIKDEANNQTTWTSGLVEIPIPMDQKIKTIEEVEAAKRKQLISELLVKDPNRAQEVKVNENSKVMKKKMKAFQKQFLQQGRIYAKSAWKKQSENASLESRK